MEKQIIGRGLLAGALAGVLAFIFARIFVEPVIDRAIGYEDGVGAAHEAMEHGGHEHGAEVFTRGMQANIGMGFGVLAFSVAMGALFAVVFAVTYGRVGNVSARLLSLYVAGGMLLSLYIVPALKYPANPPAVSLDETIRQRTLLYLLMVVVSAALFVGAVYLGRQLAARIGAWNATLAAAGSYIVAIAVVMLILPTIDETPGPLRDNAGTIIYEGFPADDLYQFRLFSLGTQVVMWATIGLVFAALASRLLDEKRRETYPGVSEVVRLTLVSHAMTDAMAAGRFPTDEPLNAVGHRQVDASIELGVTERAYCGPEKRTRQTAELLGLHASIDNRLADLDCGRWRGDVVGGVQSRRSGDLADRPDAGAARWRVGRRADRPGARVDGFTDHPSHPAGRRHAPVGDPCRDPGGAQRAPEVVLAHRHCAGKPHGDALPRARVDAALQPVISRSAPGRTPGATIDSSQPAAVVTAKAAASSTGS